MEGQGSKAHGTQLASTASHGMLLQYEASEYLLLCPQHSEECTTPRRPSVTTCGHKEPPEPVTREQENLEPELPSDG